MKTIRVPCEAAIDESALSLQMDAILDDAAPGWPDRFGNALAASTRMSRISAISLFTGAGGLDIGFHEAGFDVQAMIEVDPRFVRTLEMNTGPDRPLGASTVQCVDIRKVDPATLRHADVVIGGPPCQTFSAAGRRSHGVQGLDDPRGLLFQEYLRILEVVQPKVFVFENVYGILGAQGGRAWSQIVTSFQSVGYRTHSRILDAADYGVPQHRERLFIVGVRDGEYRFPRPTHGPDSLRGRPHFTARQAIADLADGSKEAEPLNGRYGHLLSEIPPGLNYSYFTARMGHPHPVFAWRSKFSDFLYKADPNAPVRTIKAQGGQYTGPFHWDGRRFSVAELKRLQTFPDDYEIVGGYGAAVQQIGNSVPPQLARILALTVRDQVFGRNAANLPLLEPNDRLSFRVLKKSRTAAYTETARRARARSIPIRPSTIGSRAYQATVTDAFAIVDTADGDIRVTESISDDAWGLRLIGAPSDDESVIHLTITPAKRATWSLPVSQIDVVITPGTPRMLTAGWKAAEKAVVDRSLSADLVQVSGYYQYKPQLEARIDISSAREPTDPMWSVLESVTRGHCVGAPIPANTAAFLWGVPVSDVLGICVALRGLGYEVRNHQTNPQMPLDTYLVPYRFPTLTPSSVQLTKSLA